MRDELEKCHPGNHRDNRWCRVVMVVYPLQGHITPMLQLATLLHSKGCSNITIAYPLEINPLNPSTHPEFTYLPLQVDGGLSLFRPAMVEDGLQGVLGLTIALNKSYKSPFQESVKELMGLDQKRGIKVECIIYDMYMYFAQDVADCLKIRGISLSTSCAASILGVAAMHCSHEFEYYNLPLQESLSQDPELQALELDNIVKEFNESKEMVEIKAAVTTAMSNSTAIVVNTTGFMEWAVIQQVQKYFLGSIFPMGPFHKYDKILSRSNSLLKEDSSCIAWLDQQPPRSVIYVSFGSLASMTEEDLIETAVGLAQNNLPFLWVARPKLAQGGREWDEILPHSLKERIKKMGFIVGWAPQRQILGHGSIGGFWTHCGWNSTLEGVCEGVPMICKPFFGDQFLNSKYICKVWKIGLELENKLERGNIERTLRRLMVGNEGEEMRRRAIDLKEKVDFWLKDGGSSHKFVNQLVDLIITL